MTTADIQERVMQSLTNVAPEIDPASLQPDVPLRDQVDLDSMDFLRFVRELHTTLGVDVPEADYPRIASVNGAVDYIAGRLPAPPA
jgi:acyl carrier protein